MTETLPISRGKKVKMHFQLRLANGFVVENAHDNEAFEFVSGDGNLISGLDDALQGLCANDHREITLSPEFAFGARDETNIQRMPKAEFPTDMGLEKGMIVGFTSPAGDEVPGTIMDFEADDVLVDFNHPLAGKTIIFEVDILLVENG